jgi:hypothetical protein
MPNRTPRLKQLMMSLLGLPFLAALPFPVLADYDHSKYISPDEVRPGMKGYGRTVMSGCQIDTFQFEVIAVMKNAYYAKQDVVLAKCSGLNLEHSGIIGGMSGSPCYIVDEATGQTRMLGAVAYGWSFNKDPICGIQPITQMLPIPQLRMPKDVPATQPLVQADEGEAAGDRGAGIPVGEIVGRLWAEPIDQASPLSVLNDDIKRINAGRDRREPMAAQMQPLPIPLMVSGINERVLGQMRKHCERFGFEPMASGGVSVATAEAYSNVKLEPGSALVVPMMTGDMMMEGLGTCTEVIGDRVLGFGHSMNGEGAVELPLATGMVYTVIPSVNRSNKLGAALKMVGTLYGDENTGVFGIVGKAPPMIPLEVTVHDLRGTQEYHYNLAQDENLTPMLLLEGASASVYAHNDPPEDHTIRYSVEVEFEGLGTFRSENFTSQRGMGGVGADLMMPAMSLMGAPFGKARITRAKADITVEKGARSASFDEVTLPRTVFKPGEKVEAKVRWFHYRQSPAFTNATYSIDLPKDLPDGDYELTVCSPRSHLAEMREEKPHLFRAKNLRDMLDAFNRLTGCPDNGVYLRLSLPRGGLAVDKTELPELPSFRRQILADSGRTDIHRFAEVKVARYDTTFAVTGERTFRIKVNRRADQ